MPKKTLSAKLFKLLRVVSLFAPLVIYLLVLTLHPRYEVFERLFGDGDLLLPLGLVCVSLVVRHFTSYSLVVLGTVAGVALVSFGMSVVLLDRAVKGEDSSTILIGAMILFYLIFAAWDVQGDPVAIENYSEES